EGLVGRGGRGAVAAAGARVVDAGQHGRVRLPVAHVDVAGVVAVAGDQAGGGALELDVAPVVAELREGGGAAGAGGAGLVEGDQGSRLGLQVVDVDVLP